MADLRSFATIDHAASSRLGRSADSTDLTIVADLTPVGLFEYFQYAPGLAGHDTDHVHQAVQVCLSLNFDGRYRSGRFAAEVPARSISLVDAWEPHAAEDPCDRPFHTRYQVLYVSRTQWDAVAAQDEREPRVGILVRRDPSAARAFRRLVSAAAHRDSRMTLDERLGTLLTRLLRRRRPARSRPADSQRLARARDFIRVHAAAGVSLAEASSAAGLSPQHFAASFRARYGLPPHRFQTLMRLEHARRLLAAGVPAAAVAAQCGFSDQSHLIRHFKRYLGLVPSRYLVGAGIPGHPTPPPLESAVARDRTRGRMLIGPANWTPNSLPWLELCDDRSAGERPVRTGC